MHYKAFYTQYSQRFPPIIEPLSFYTLSPVEKEYEPIQLDLMNFIVDLYFTQKAANGKEATVNRALDGSRYPGKS
jgi:hypothetical protein